MRSLNTLTDPPSDRGGIGGAEQHCIAAHSAGASRASGAEKGEWLVNCGRLADHEGGRRADGEQGLASSTVALILAAGGGSVTGAKTSHGSLRVMDD